MTDLSVIGLKVKWLTGTLIQFRLIITSSEQIIHKKGSFSALRLLYSANLKIHLAIRPSRNCSALVAQMYLAISEAYKVAFSHFLRNKAK